MKQKNRTLTGLLLLALCLALTACGGEKTLGVVKNQETGASLSLGMTREEVETALKLSSEEKEHRPDKTWPELKEALSWQAHYGKLENLITVCYDWDTDKVVELGVEQSPSNWVLDGAITTGATKEEIKKQYGEPSVPEDQAIYYRNDNTQAYGVGLSYNYDADGAKTDGTNTDMFLSFMIDPDGELDHVGVIKYDKKYDIVGVDDNHVDFTGESKNG